MLDCIMWGCGIVIMALYLRARLNTYYQKPSLDARYPIANPLVHSRATSYLGVPGVDPLDFSPEPNAHSYDD